MVIPKKLMLAVSQQLKVMTRTLATLEGLMKAGNGVPVSDGGEPEIFAVR